MNSLYTYKLSNFVAQPVVYVMLFGQSMNPLFEGPHFKAFKDTI